MSIPAACVLDGFSFSSSVDATSDTTGIQAKKDRALRRRRIHDADGLGDIVDARAPQRHEQQRLQGLAAQVDLDKTEEQTQTHHDEGDKEAPAQQGEGIGVFGHLLCEDDAQAEKRLAAERA